jgi:hypothetical protein
MRFLGGKWQKKKFRGLMAEEMQGREAGFSTALLRKA